MISKDTADWLRSLPHPDDKEGWRERERAMVAELLGGIAKPDEPLPWDDDDAERMAEPEMQQ